ncbi:deoxyhypusine synthase [Candidatus Pacearchaeota archaeon]|nr:deoxyhypusine synthase [Candidatus Pacearchaeota archaeon]|tara:strand:- start:1698 stop:2756 length:1059 start_codon:yes stop_codon:yes gene_type:complete
MSNQPSNNNKKSPEQTGRDNVMFSSIEPTGLKIKGYDFNQPLNYEKLLDSYLTTGFQATHLAKAINIINKMQEEKVTIYLGYTSNMVTSGLRDIFRYLAEHNKIHTIVTTAGGIEEDIIKCLGDFKLGTFSASGELLNKEGVNRTGNIFVPNERYCKFEDFINPILEEIYENQKATGKIITVSELIKILGKKINNPNSIYYWCYKNDIDVYCPAITDGSLGDMIHFFQYKHPDFKIDIANDIHKLNEYTITRKKTGLIILGRGIMKHHILNTNMMRNGSDYSVYINTGEEWDGADSNARPDEAVSWGKLKPSNKGSSIEETVGVLDKEPTSIKVFGDATLLFPLIVARCFKD